MVKQKLQPKEPNGKVSEWKKMKLVSIAFKEASLDTPSFRASVNHFQTRTEIFQEWMEKVVDFIYNKYSSSMEDFQRAHNTFISLLLPSPMILSNGFVANQANTPSLVGSFNQTFYELSSKVFKVVCEKDYGSPNSLLELMNTAIEPYKDRRANFDYYQSKYDNMLGKYQAIKISNTNLEPATIKEDAFQIFEIRKEYLKSSLELVCAISTMKLAIDKFLLEVMETIQTRASQSMKEIGQFIDLAPALSASLKDYAHWIENSIASTKILASDMQKAKQQVMEYSLSKIAPAQEVNDYNVKSINFSSLLSKKTEAIKNPPEKSGWLYMKTTVGSPSRTVWVRRWCFLKNSVFGLFLLSSSKTSVEETDKFGVLLTSIRYDPDEDRKFCFEVKIMTRSSKARTNSIKDIHLVLQAESLQELKSWLNTFDASKRYAYNLSHDSAEYDMAFKRYFPEFLEFASSTTTTTDQLITTCDENTMSIMSMTDSELASLYMESSAGHKYFQFQLAGTPISTKLTPVAVMANLYKKSHHLPNAILANIWGSANWSDYAIYDDEEEEPAVSTKKLGRGMTTSTLVYPNFYPNQMKVEDVQFKSLFFTINQKLNQFPDELLLFNFSSFWFPNKRQKFSANCYVTVDHIYCYMNSMGFICLTHRSLGDLVSVEVDTSADNLLRIYDVNGIQLKMFVYFVDRQLIANKLQYLLENKALKQPKKEEEIFKRLNVMDSEFQERHRRSTLAGSKIFQNHADTDNSFGTKLCESFWPNDEESSDLSRRRKSIQREYSVMYRHAYEVSSKCLIHILYGDQSIAFPRSLLLATKDTNSNISSNWMQENSADGQGQLVRTLEFNLNLTDSFLGNVRRGQTCELKLKQRMVRVIENKYYEIEQDPIIIKIPFCRPLRVKAKHVIMEANESRFSLNSPSSSSACLLYIFYKLQFLDPITGKCVNNLTFAERAVMPWARHFTSFEYASIRKMIRYYLEKIGKHGKTIKAIKICGMIGVAKSRAEQNDESKGLNNSAKSVLSNEKLQEDLNIDVVYSLSIIFKVILKLIGYKITNFAFLFLRYIFRWLLLMVSNVTHINRTLLLGLLLSITVNIFLSGKSSVAYWSVKRAETAFHDYAKENSEVSMHHAITIKDLDLLKFTLAYENDNLPYKKFNHTHSAEIYKYKATREEISAKRNEALIELKILQNMERELVQDQYKKFLVKELENCHIVEQEVSQVWSNDTQLQKYCQSCSTELYRVGTLLL